MITKNARREAEQEMGGHKAIIAAFEGVPFALYTIDRFSCVYNRHYGTGPSAAMSESIFLSDLPDGRYIQATVSVIIPYPEENQERGDTAKAVFPKGTVVKYKGRPLALPDDTQFETTLTKEEIDKLNSPGCCYEIVDDIEEDEGEIDDEPIRATSSRAQRAPARRKK